MCKLSGYLPLITLIHKEYLSIFWNLMCDYENLWACYFLLFSSTVTSILTLLRLKYNQ